MSSTFFVKSVKYRETLTLATKLSKEKKWQCPHCTQDSDRHLNLAVHIKRLHGGVGDPVEKGNMGQHANSSPSGDGRLTHGVKPPSSYNHSKHVHTNNANKGNKDHDDIIDNWYQTVLELEEKEHKIMKIKECYCRNPDASMLIPSIDPSILPIKKYIGAISPKSFFSKWS